MRLGHLKLLGGVFAALMTVGTASADEVKLRCAVEKVVVKHPYLPSEIILSIEGRYEEFFVEDVQIPNVSTLPVPGEVTYQGRKKVRVTWPSSGYSYQGNLLPKAVGNRSFPPEDFKFNLSLEKETWKFKVELHSVVYGTNNYGRATGRCVPISGSTS